MGMLLNKLPEPTRVTKQAYSTTGVVAGPLGFYGVAYGVVMTARYDNKEEALAAIDEAANLIEQSRLVAAPHAWRMLPYPT